MAQQYSSLSTREFSELTGIAVSTVNRLLREGKIKGVKTAGKWKIDKTEMTAKAIQAILKPPGKGGAAPGKIDRMAAKKEKVKGPGVPTGGISAAAGTKATSGTSADGAQTYSVTEFSGLTYLTEYGVLEFLKKGRLQGIRDEKGQWRLGADNLRNPGMRHLLR
ncbi:MAG: helix-turn-helix domain-containing protein [Desulfobacterales bacterium]|jgi:excisionase family DNA binding protein